MPWLEDVVESSTGTAVPFRWLVVAGSWLVAFFFFFLGENTEQPTYSSGRRENLVLFVCLFGFAV